MRNIVPTVFVLAAALPFAGQGLAAERFQLERTEGGFVRMDTETGQMSFCETGSDGLACKDAGGGSPAGAGRIDALEKRIDALEKRIGELGAGTAHNALPSDQEFEQTMSLMERFMRRFMGIVKEFETEAGQEQEAAPDRT
ncbi:hypothetical protein [Mesorhizobium sp. Z1-4]|uniref:hypothetical protein n=1 Tax=Mesorhizobium sp. Z1-4 TaxID=2448478 RepID=UPI000FDA061B|nr:hypothetical protein [Mesorhizobium sp. Z1-4]